MINPDILIEVRFNTPDEDGRKTPISGNTYSCPLFIDEEAFDCRIQIGNQVIVLGVWYQLAVKFLIRDRAVSKLSLGKSIFLWEGKKIAQGKVVEIFTATGL